MALPLPQPGGPDKAHLEPLQTFKPAAGVGWRSHVDVHHSNPLITTEMQSTMQALRLPLHFLSAALQTLLAAGVKYAGACTLDA